MRPSLSVLIGILCCLSLLPLAGWADDVADAGRRIVAQWQQTVVTLEVENRVTFTNGGAPAVRNLRVVARGSVIDPSGLTATAFWAVNRFTGIFGEAEIVNPKIILPDGTILPAEVVSHDENLAFFRPLKAPAQPLLAIAGENATPNLLDRVFVLNRLGAAEDRAITVAEERINALVDRPQQYSVLYTSRGVGLYSGNNVGGPVFAEDGRPLGILVILVSPDAAAPDPLTAKTLVAVIPMAVVRAAVRVPK